ncbi:MAG TPA: geranylgeranylglycerol-phosphate geranylgeranyltransferase [Flavobacteriaceae bacterium]|nr:geranylgeranylglycerol-phosphate geranylgeranyltransferase [Flavobacteriaceae bacterium]
MKYLKLIGYQDLLMIAGVQILIKYFLFIPFQIDYALNDLGTFLLILATLSIAAAGKIIIALNNMEADRINEKLLIGTFISEKRAYNLFFGLTVLGVLIGFYLSNVIEHSAFSAIAILVSGLIYVYATYLKKILIISDVVIAVLSTLPIIVLAIYDLLPAITPENKATQSTIFSVLLDYALWAFLLTWLRQILRGQLEMNGDHKVGNQTLSVTFGKTRTNKILFFAGFLPLICLIYYMAHYLFGNQLVIGYVLVLILGPLLFFTAKIISAKNQKTYLLLFRILTFCMWFSLLSIGMFTYILR